MPYSGPLGGSRNHREPLGTTVPGKPWKVTLAGWFPPIGGNHPQGTTVRNHPKVVPDPRPERMSVDLPTPESVDQLIATLERHQRKPAGGGVAPLQSIRARLLGAVEREAEHGTVAADGWTTRTIGDGMPRGGGSGLTATEAAASARMARPPRDDHRRLTVKAAVALERAVESLNGLLAALDDLDVLRGVDATHEPCEACGPHRDVLADIHRRGDVGGRLETPHALCLACYNYTVRYGRLPIAPDIAYHEGTGRWPK